MRKQIYAFYKHVLTSLLAFCCVNPTLGQVKGNRYSSLSSSSLKIEAQSATLQKGGNANHGGVTLDINAIISKEKNGKGWWKAASSGTVEFMV